MTEAINGDVTEYSDNAHFPLVGGWSNSQTLGKTFPILWRPYGWKIRSATFCVDQRETPPIDAARRAEWKNTCSDP